MGFWDPEIEVSADITAEGEPIEIEGVVIKPAEEYAAPVTPTGAVSAIPAYTPDPFTAPTPRENLLAGRTFNEDVAKQEFKETLEAGGYKVEDLERSWEIEKKEVARAVEAVMPYGGSITESQTQKAISYYEDIGEPQRAEDIGSYYVSRGDPTRVVERAVGIGYGPFAALEDYRDGDSYRLSEALVDEAVVEGDLKGFFPEAEISRAVLGASIFTSLEKVGFAGPEGVNLAGALAAGAITVDQAYKYFRKEDVDKVVGEGKPSDIDYLTRQLGREPTFKEYQAYMGLEEPKIGPRFFAPLVEAWQIFQPGKQAWDIYREEMGELHAKYVGELPHLKWATIPEVFEFEKAPLPGARLIPPRVVYPQITWADIPRKEIALRAALTAGEIALWTAPKWVPPVARWVGGKVGVATPKTYYPFPKESIAYGPRGEVLVNLGSKYGWLPYDDALYVLQTDIAMARVYQPPYAFGAKPGFWPRTEPMVVGGRVVPPRLVESGLLLKYPTLEKIALGRAPYYPSASTIRTIPGYYYPDVTGPSPWVGTKPIVGTPVYGEIPGMPPIQAISLGGVGGMPPLGIGPGSFSYGVAGHPGWAPYQITSLPISLEPYAIPRIGLYAGGTSFPSPYAPTIPKLGAPTIPMPTTATMTQAGVAQQLASLGMYPSPLVAPKPISITVTPAPISFPSISPMPIVSPMVSPIGAPIVSPVTGLGISPYISPLVAPSPFVAPSPTPIVPSRMPGTTLVTPITTSLPPPPPIPPLIFPGLPALGRLIPTRPKVKVTGVGTWKFAGFPVRGPHPLTLEMVGYEWMGGKQVPWGVGKSLPAIRRKQRKFSLGKEGLVRMYR